MKTLFSRLDFSYIYVLLGEATLGLTFLFYIILARVLGPEKYEIFAAAVALGAILSLFIQFGLPTLLAREVAANPQVGARDTLKFLLLEGVIFLPVLLLLLPIAQLLGYKGDGLVVCYLVMGAELCRAMKMTLRGVLRGVGWFKVETISVGLERFFAVCLAGIVLLLTHNLVWVVTAFTLGRLLDIIGLTFLLSRKLQIWSAISWGNCWRALRAAYPFALSGVLWILYYQVDLVMLKGIAPAGEAGFYSAAYKIMEIFSALPRVVFYVAFTKFAYSHATAPEKLPEEIYKSLRLLLGIVLPILVIVGLLETNLVKIIYGEAYLAAAKPLAILIPSLGIKMFGTLAEHFLQTTGREKYLPPLLLSATVTNVICNLILIPKLGGMGAAIATLLSETLVCTIGLILMSRMGYRHVSLSTGAIAAISLFMVLLPSFMLNGLTPIVAIGLIIPSAIALVALMRRDRFLSQTT